MADETSETEDSELHRYHFRKRPPSQEIVKQKPIKKRPKKAKKSAVRAAPPSIQDDDSLDLADEEHDCDIIIKDEPFFEDADEQCSEMGEEEEENQNYFEEVRMEEGPMLTNMCDDVNLDEESDPLSFSYPASMLPPSPTSNLPLQDSVHIEDTRGPPDDSSPSKRYAQTFFIKKEKNPDPPPIQIKKEKQEIESDNEDDLNNTEMPNDNLDLPFNTICDINKIKLESNQESFGNFADYENGINLNESNCVGNTIDPLAFAPLLNNTDLSLEYTSVVRDSSISKPETVQTPTLLSVHSQRGPNISVQIYENQHLNPFSKSNMLEKIASEIDPNSEFCKEVSKLTSKDLQSSTDLNPEPQQESLLQSNFEVEKKIPEIPTELFFHKGVIYRTVFPHLQKAPQQKIKISKLPDIRLRGVIATTSAPTTETTNTINISRNSEKPVSVAGSLVLCKKTEQLYGTGSKNYHEVYEQQKRGDELESGNTIWGRFEKSKGFLEAANWVPVEGTSDGVLQKYRKVVISNEDSEEEEDFPQQNSKVPAPLGQKSESSKTGGNDEKTVDTLHSRNNCLQTIDPKVPVDSTSSLAKPLLPKPNLPAIIASQSSKQLPGMSREQSENPPPPITYVKKSRKQELKPRLEPTTEESKKEDKSIHKPRKQTLQVNDYRMKGEEDEFIYICCKHCKKSFIDVKSYENHRRPYEINVINRICKLCKEQCSSACEILTHYIYHTTIDKVNLCLLTTWDFKNPKAQILEYIRLFDNIGVGSFICICRRRFDFRRELLLHVEKYYERCKEIRLFKRVKRRSRSTPVRPISALKSRRTLDIDKRREAAKEKRERFKLAHNYNVPKRKVSRAPICRKCKLQFDNRCVYLEHIRFEHNESYYCEHCKFYVDDGDKVKLQRHIIRHHVNQCWGRYRISLP